MTEGKKYYLGIDLGTTNTRAAYGYIPGNNLKISMIDITAESEDGSLKDFQLIPSFVYYPKDKSQPPIVGPKARENMKTQPSRVVRSIKSRMGIRDPSEFQNIDGIQHSPVEISSIILKTIMKGIFKYFPNNNDIVITVPASFDSDMRQDTLKAAEEAGIKMTDDDGTKREILLDEPRATLFDFVYRQHIGDIPPTVIDFSSKKTVLIYDLGGGTLDVSIHEVNFIDPEAKMPQINDLAISRYNKLGGDNFDYTLADYLYKKYIEEYHLIEEKYNPSEVTDVKTKLLYEAESFKRRITNIANMRLDQDPNFDIYSLKEKILSNILFDMCPFSIELSLKDYEEIIKSYSATNLKFPTKDNIEKIIEGNNLIVPIIDTLRKAYKKASKIIKPELILLTGGMTLLPTIQRRLEKFFGQKPFLMKDPDKSVARGAAVYHYYLHNGFKPSVILAESILIGVLKGDQEVTTEIVAAGEVLPFKSDDLPFIVPKDDLSSLLIPFYRTDKSTPLAKRYFKFSTKRKKNTEIIAQVEVNTQKILSFKAWLKEDPSQKIEVVLDPSKYEETTSTIVKDLTKPVDTTVHKKIDPMVIDQVFSRIMSNNIPDWPSSTPEIEVLNAKNLDELIKHSINLLDKKTLNLYAKARLTKFLGDVARNPYFRENFSEWLEKMQKKFISYIESIRALPDPKTNEINSRVSFTIEALGRIRIIDKDRNILKLLFGLINNLTFDSIIEPILNALGKLPPDIEIFEIFKKVFSKMNTKGRQIKLLWVIGKQGTREVEKPLSIERIAPIIPNIVKLLQETKDYELIQYSVYALIETCCPDPNKGGCISLEDRQKVIECMQKVQKNPLLRKTTVLKDYSRIETANRWLTFGINRLRGITMTEDERIMLMGLREPKEKEEM